MSGEKLTTKFDEEPKYMEDKDKTIVALRQQLWKVLQENSAQKQEIALLNYELERSKIRSSK